MEIIVRDTATHGPCYEQIRSQISDQIRSGLLASGSELPRPAKIAEQINVDRGEVSRAYFELEQQGLIVSKKTKNFLGETVTSFRVS